MWFICTMGEYSFICVFMFFPLTCILKKETYSLIYFANLLMIKFVLF